MGTHDLHRRVCLGGAIGLVAVLGGVAPNADRFVIAQQRDCNRPLPEAIATFDGPSGEPAQTSDGCWLFTAAIAVPNIETRTGIAALRRTDSGFELHRFLSLDIPRPGGPLSPPPFGMALTRDDKMLVVSLHQRLTFLDVGKMTSAESDPVLGVIESQRLSRGWGVVVSPDDKYAYAAQQGTSSVVIIDLDRIRSGVFNESALHGLVRTAPGATTPVLSPDGRYLYTTTLRPPDVVDAPLTCQGGKVAEGAIQVIDVQRARTDPSNATIGFASPAGCNPVFMAVSPDGGRLSVTPLGATGQGKFAESEHTIVVFDTSPLASGNPPALVARVPVPPQPLRVVDTGDRLIVAFNHQTYPAPEAARAVVVDASKLAAGKGALLGRLPFGALGMRLSADRRTLFASAGAWNHLVVVDLQRAKLEPPAN